MPENHENSKEELLADLEAARRRIAELECRLSECAEEKKGEVERFRRLFQEAPLGYQSLDENGNLIEVNRAWLDLTGYAEGEVLGKNFADFLPPEWREHFRENFPRFKAVGEIPGVEFELLKKDGSRVLVSFNGRIGRDDKGGFRQTHCIMHDVTEKRRAEEELRVIGQMFSTTRDLMALVGPDYEYRFANRAYAEFFGLSPERVTGRRLADVLGREVFESLVRPRLDKALAGESLNYTEWLDHGEDGRRCLNATYAPCLDADGTVLGVTVVVRDVTERVRAEKDLRESEERFRSIVDVLPQYVAYTDKDLVYRFVNKTYERAFGAASEDMVGRTLPDVIGDEAFEAARGNVQRALAGEYVHYQTDLTYPGGVRRSIDGHLVPDFSPDGGVQGYYAVLTDVSHLKEVEKKLRESRELFRKAFDNEHVAVAITRMQDGTYLEANPGFTAITGYDREEVVGKTPMELGFYDAEWRREVLDDFVAGSRNLELSYPDKFGRRRTILYSIAPIAYKGEDCLLATMVDITERKTTEAALAESEREKSLILGSISDLVVYYESPELVIKWTNRAAAESAGQSVEGLLGESCYEVWGEGGTPCEGCLVLEVFEKGRAMEMERERPDGRVWYLRAYPALDESGAVRGVVEVGRDVTDERRAAKEREKAREELRRSEKLLSLSQSVSRVGGWYRDLRNGATYWTDEHYRVLGYEPGEVVPSKELFMDHVHPDDRDFVDNARETAIAGGPDYDAEYRLVRKNGALRTVRTVGRMYPDLNGEPRFMFGSIQDVTEQKEVEEALRRSLAEKEAMLLEIHHRVKNNLQVILGLLDMTRYRTKSEEAAEVIREVHAKINSMALIHNALYREENLESIDVSGFAEMLMAQLARLYGGSRVRREVGGRRVRLSLEKAVPLGLALNEILTNAFKYAFAGGEGAIVCDMDETDGLVRVEVSDDGAGLPENFDPRTTNTLGFKLVRDLVEMQLGGEMLVDGEEGVKVGLIFPA